MPDLTIPVNLRGFQTGDADPRRPDAPHAGPQPDLPAHPQPNDDAAKKRAYGVQFTRPLTPEEEAALSHLGVSLDAYVSDFTYLVLVDEPTLTELRAHPLYNADFRLDAANKRSPDIGKRQFVTDKRKQMAPSLLMLAVLFRNADADAVVAALQALGAQKAFVLDDRARQGGGNVRIQFTIPSQAPIPAIAAIEEIRWLEEVPEARSNSPALAGLVQSGIQDDTPYWKRKLRGQKQVIGVLDSGALDLAHCWFKDRPNNDPRPGHRKVVSHENASHAAAAGHPTYVCGIAAGDDIDNSGGHPDRGVAWSARIAYGNRDDFELEPPQKLLDYLDLARAAGARIHTNSWHDDTSSPNYTDRAAEFDSFAWSNEDCLIVASSGNLGEDRGPPGTAKNSLCVSAGYVNGAVSCFGDGVPGPTVGDQRRKPDLMGPGCETSSAAVGSACGTVVDTVAGDTTPAEQPPHAPCVTSYATPAVAAAAAIVRQYFLNGWYPDGNPASPAADPFEPSGALIKAVLLNAASKTSACPDYPSDKEGWGLLRLKPILRLEGGLTKIWVKDVPHADGLRTLGPDRTHTVHIGASDQPLKVTLVWTDYPGDPTTDKVLVNDLDLEVTAPGAMEAFKGNYIIGNQSVLGGSADDRNTVEMVYVPAPLTGAWTIRVKGTTIAKGFPGQGYALVVSGSLADPPM